MKLFVKNVEHSCWEFLLNTWSISLRVHQYGFALLKRLGIATNAVFGKPRAAKSLKNEQRWVSFKTSLQIHSYIPLLHTQKN